MITKKLLMIYLAFMTLFTVSGQKFPSKDYEEKYKEIMERTSWWRHDRFGMFIHWGVYAVPARGEWVKSIEKMTTEEYQPYVEQFYPSAFDASEWARLAKQAGMKYAVLTAKHHDGFCMFDSEFTDYKISNYFNGRDIVSEFLNAFRAEGLKVGLYYSLIDWHHPDYPNVGNHPQRDDKEYGKQDFDWDNYLDYMHAQVKELVTGYGEIDIMWFDYSFDEYQGEKWGATKLVEMVRKEQPGIILDSRLGLNQGVSGESRELGYGDFETPEQGIPEEPILDKHGNPMPWETCLTLNNNWGYNRTDEDWKSTELVIHSLVECVSKNGNLLLNVGPDAMGKIPDESVQILTKVGEWMARNGESIYGCGGTDNEKPVWGRITGKENKLYLHWMYPKVGHINLEGYHDKVKFVSLLPDGSELPTAGTWWGNQEEGNFFINVESPTYKTYPLPDDINTVIEVELK
jgi:alpha-L-fucosidase